MNILPLSGRNRRTVQLTQYSLALAGVAALGYCLVVSVNAKLFQARAARNFSRELLAKESARRTASIPIPTSAVPQDGAVLGRLEIPRLGLGVMVVEGVEDNDLKLAAGHIPGTTLPGQTGNVGIAGHRDTFFRPLRGIRQNDTIT